MFFGKVIFLQYVFYRLSKNEDQDLIKLQYVANELISAQGFANGNTINYN